MPLARNGVVVSLASNNILNPFTPFGDCSLCRMANLFANIAQLACDDDIAAVFSFVTESAARQLGARYGLSAGQPADVVVLDAPDPISAIREIASPLVGWKRGQMVFQNGRAQLMKPSKEGGRAQGI
jgi:cytosine deaminase